MSNTFPTAGLGSINCSGGANIEENMIIRGNLKVHGTTEISKTTNSTGNITGNLTGNVTGDVSGNVTGDVTGNVTGDVTGNVTIPASTPPASASDDGQPGQIAWGADYIYVCIAANTWKRAELSSW